MLEMDENFPPIVIIYVIQLFGFLPVFCLFFCQNSQIHKLTKEIFAITMN